MACLVSASYPRSQARPAACARSANPATPSAASSILRCTSASRSAVASAGGPPPAGLGWPGAARQPAVMAAIRSRSRWPAVLAAAASARARSRASCASSAAFCTSSVRRCSSVRAASTASRAARSLAASISACWVRVSAWAVRSRSRRTVCTIAMPPATARATTMARVTPAPRLGSLVRHRPVLGWRSGGHQPVLLQAGAAPELGASARGPLR